LCFAWIADGFLLGYGQVARWIAKAATVEALHEAARKEKERVQMLLNARTEVIDSCTGEI